MNNWTEKEEQALMNYIEANDSETAGERIVFAHHMMYHEGNHPELKQRTLNALISRYYKVCERRHNER